MLGPRRKLKHKIHVPHVMMGRAVQEKNPKSVSEPVFICLVGRKTWLICDSERKKLLTLASTMGQNSAESFGDGVS